jgi:hypothetical protein
LAPEPRANGVVSRAAKAAAGSPLAGVPVAFRMHQFEPPINDQPTPWIQNIPRTYFLGYHPNGTLPKSATVAATFEDGSPAAYIASFGKGEVLVFTGGTIDWLACPGLARRIDDWGNRVAPSAPSASAPADPELLVSALAKGDDLFLLGRRFIDQDDIATLKGGKTPASATVAKRLSLVFPHIGHGSYHVRELVGDRDLGTLSGSQLGSQGVALDLTPGEGFLIEAVPGN